ncbi:cofilin [Apophysomyces ossiformis]|uniref:Cofilin n=1 Tax=Apophysomyces ossiformis TaxID=679940 RepID=A0A8H7ERB5_9FUNG|nr:cofilin [Apophysomyces ossiformis]
MVEYSFWVHLNALLTVGVKSSGVRANQDCIDSYNDLKLGKKFKYIIYKLSDDNSEIMLDKTAETGTYDEFLSNLPDAEPRFAVYDFDYEKPGEGSRNKITFYSWIPDTSAIRKKMIYASSKDAIRKRLEGIAVEIQGTDSSEVAYETVLEKALRSG